MSEEKIAMPAAGAMLYLALTDPSGNFNGFSNFLAASIFSAPNKDSPAGQVNLAVIEGPGLTQTFPSLVDFNSLTAIHVSQEWKYGPIPALMLPTTPYGDVRNRLHALPGLTLPAEGGAAMVMISTQLSGCSLCYRPAMAGAEDVKIIHIQPDKAALDEDMPGNDRIGVRLQDLLQRDHATFEGDNDRPTRIYGARDTGYPNANIIALRKDRRWTLFAQKFFAHQARPLGVDIVQLY